MKKTANTVDEMASLTGIDYIPTDGLFLSEATPAKKEVVAQTLTDCIDIEGIEICYNTYNDYFWWDINKDCQYGPPSEHLQLRYTGLWFGYDENGYLLSPFQMLDGKDIDKLYGFQANGNRSHCLPVRIMTKKAAENDVLYDELVVEADGCHRIEALLYVVEWGGSNCDTTGLDDLETFKNLLKKSSLKGFFYRTKSNGGKKGVDYYVLEVVNRRHDNLKSIVTKRYNQLQDGILEGMERYARKLDLVQKISDRLVDIRKNSEFDAYNLLNELKKTEVAQLDYVDELVLVTGNYEFLLKPPTYDYELKSLEEAYQNLNQTEKVCKRIMRDNVDQIKRWEALSPQFPELYRQAKCLGGTLTIDLYNIAMRLPSIVDAGQYVAKTFSINKVQIHLLEEKLLEYRRLLKI